MRCTTGVKKVRWYCLLFAPDNTCRSIFWSDLWMPVLVFLTAVITGRLHTLQFARLESNIIISNFLGEVMVRSFLSRFASTMYWCNLQHIKLQIIMGYDQGKRATDRMFLADPGFPLLGCLSFVDKPELTLTQWWALHARSCVLTT